MIIVKYVQVDIKEFWDSAEQFALDEPALSFFTGFLNEGFVSSLRAKTLPEYEEWKSYLLYSCKTG